MDRKKQSIISSKHSSLALWPCLRYAVTILLLSVLVSCSQQPQKSLKVGDQAPDFTLKDIQGRVFSLEESEGKPVILRFFLPDCKFCRADTPIFNRFYERYKSKGLRVIYIETLGITDQELQKFQQKLHIPFPVARDLNGKVAAAYTVKALPQTVVLDKEHKIIAAILGGVSAPELQKLLSPYLASK